MSGPESGGYRPPPTENEPASPSEPAENKELSEKRLFSVVVSYDSLASQTHRYRNEDGILGDEVRAATEEVRQPPLSTAKPLDDQRAVVAAAQRERAAADRLADLEIYGAGDGISGEGLVGTGYLSNRLALAAISERLAELPLTADAEMTRVALVAALGAANDSLKDYVKGRTDLQDRMGTTMTLLRTLAQPDGRPRVVFAHNGNTRLYRLKASTGELTCETTDDTLAGAALRHHLDPTLPEPGLKNELTAKSLTPEQYRRVNEAERSADVPVELQEYVQRRNLLYPAKRVIGCALPGTLETQSGIIDAEPDDVFAILSDGLVSLVPEQDIAKLLAKEPTARVLISEAGILGPDDDATAVVIKMKRTGP